MYRVWLVRAMGKENNPVGGPTNISPVEPPSFHHTITVAKVEDDDADRG